MAQASQGGGGDNKVAELRAGVRQGGGGGGGKKRDGTALWVPRDFPIVPIGYWVDDTGKKHIALIDSSNDLVAAPVDKISRNVLSSWFAQNPLYLRTWWPRFPKGKNDHDVPVPVTFLPDSFKADKVADLVIALCTEAGPIDIANAVRGRGCWRGEDDDLVVHLGNVLLLPKSWQEVSPGRRGEGPEARIYKRQEALPAPQRRAEFSAAPARLLRDVFAKLPLENREFSARLLTGMIGCMFLGGALDQRPHVIATGPKGSCKTLLQGIVKAVLGRWVLQFENFTPAGVYQQLRGDALAIALDEVENRPDQLGRQNDLLAIMRAAFSGGAMTRGSGEGKATTTALRSCFILTAIQPPTLEPQDRSRIAWLELRPLPAGTRLQIPVGEMPAWGEAILGRLVTRWPQVRASIAVHRAALGDLGADGRHADTYGQLLGVAWAMLEDAEPGRDCLEPWADLMGAMLAQHKVEEVEPWRDLLDRILSSPAEVIRRSSVVLVGEVMRLALGYGPASADPEVTRQGDERTEEDADRIAGGQNETDAAHQLTQMGLRIVTMRMADGRLRRRYLAVANRHPALNRMLAGTPWEGSGWSIALARAPDAVQSRHGYRFPVTKQRAVLLPIGLVIDGHLDQAQDHAAEDEAAVAAAQRRRPGEPAGMET